MRVLSLLAVLAALCVTAYGAKPLNVLREKANALEPSQPVKAHVPALFQVSEQTGVALTLSLLAAVGTYLSAGATAADHNRVTSVWNAHDKISNAQKSTSMWLEKLDRIQKSLEKDFTEGAVSNGIKDLIDQAVQADTAVAAGAAVPDANEVANEAFKDALTSQSIHLSLSTVGHMSHAVGSAEPFISGLLTIVHVGKSVKGFAKDRESMYAEVNAAQVTGILGRGQSASLLASCKAWSSLYTELSRAKAGIKDSDERADKLRVFVTHLLGQLEKTFRCNCASQPKGAAPSDPSTDIVQVTIARNGAAGTEVNPETVENGVPSQPTAAMSVKLSVKKRSQCADAACKKLPPVTDIAVAHRPCEKHSEETHFEKRLKEIGYTLASTSGYDNWNGVPGDACHKKVKGDTNVGRTDNYFVVLVYVKAAWGVTPLKDIQIKYGDDTETQDNYYRVPLSTNAIDATWGTLWGRMIGSYSDHNPYIEFRSVDKLIPCPKDAAADVAWCSKKADQTKINEKCSWVNWELRGQFEKGFREGAKSCLEQEKKEEVIPFFCAKHYIANKAAKGLTINWVSGCRTGCWQVRMKMTYQTSFRAWVTPESFPLVAPAGGLKSENEAAAGVVAEVEAEVQKVAALQDKTTTWLKTAVKVKVSRDDAHVKDITAKPNQKVQEVLPELAEALGTDVAGLNTKFSCLFKARTSYSMLLMLDVKSPMAAVMDQPTTEAAGSTEVDFQCITKKTRPPLQRP